MAVSYLIMILSIALLLYATKQFQTIGNLLPGKTNSRIIRRMALLLGMLLTTYLGFAFLFTMDFDFHNTNAVMSLLLLLSALYLVILSSFTVIVKQVSEKEVKKANEKLRLLNTKKKQLVSILAHELKTPVTSISGFVQLLQRPKVEQKKRAEYLRIVVEDTKRLNRLITNITDLAKLDLQVMTFNMGEVKISEVLAKLRDVYDVLAREKEIKTSYRSRAMTPLSWVTRSSSITS